MTELDRWKIRGRKFLLEISFFRSFPYQTTWSLTGRGRRPLRSKKSLNIPYIIQSIWLKQFNNCCSVRICNTTSEICEGEGQICTGIDRGKRSLDYSNDFYNSSESGSILPFMNDSERDKRSPGDYIPLHEDTQQFISRGPILAYIKDDTGQGEFTVNSIFLDIGTIFKSIFMTMTHRI